LIPSNTDKQINEIVPKDSWAQFGDKSWANAAEDGDDKWDDKNRRGLNIKS
jgi:hypothetical protein